jgi:micrococcal nuclease
MSVGENTKYLPPVEAAEREAQREGAGLYSTTTSCTIPAQVAALETTAASTFQEQPATDSGLDSFDDYWDELVVVAVRANAVMALLDGATDTFPLRAHDAVEITELRARVAAVQTKFARVKQSNANARAAEQKRLDDAAKRAAEEAARKAAEEAARKAAEEEAARRAAEEAEAAREAAEAAANKPSSPRRTPSPGSGSSSGGSSGSGSSGGGSSAGGGGSSGSGGSGGYTGCRSYAPGGKSYTPIDCDTKKPIG